MPTDQPELALTKGLVFRELSFPWRYGFALGLFALAMLLRLALMPSTGDIATFLPFILAVTLTAYFGGRGPAFLCILLSLPAVPMLGVEGGFGALDSLAWIESLVLFIVVTAIVTETVHRLHATARALRLSLAERQQSEQVVIALEQRFQRVADHAPVLIWRSNAQDQAVWFNRPWREFTGRSIERDGRDHWIELVHPDDRATFENSFRRNTAQRTPFEIEFRMRRADSVYRWMMTRGVPIFDGSAAAFSGYIGTCLDITDRKESEDRLRSILDRASAVVFLKNRDGRYLFVNEEFYRAYGIPTSEVVGRLDRDVFPPETVKELRSHDIQVWSTGCPLTAEETVPQRDAFRTCITTKFLLNDVAGQPYALCGIATDISDRKRMEDELLEADRRKDVFLAVLAHELRNPLAPIRTAVKLLARSDLPREESGRARQIIDRQSHQLVLLLDDLLDISRIARGTLELRKSSFDISVAVDAAVETARPILDERGHTLDVELPDAPMMIEADSLRVSQILANLLTNAAKYTEPHGKITLSAVLEGEDVVFRVTDNGIGISAEEQPNLFQMFTRVHANPARAPGGLGVGLALTRGLVELHKGHIEAQSEGLGRGSVFTVRLPAGEVSDPLHQVRVRNDDPSPGAFRRVLIADDNEDAAVSLNVLLACNGYEVHTVHDGAAAFDAARDYHPHFAILDIGMPGLSGYEVAERIRAEPWGENIVLIALTGWGQASDKRRALEAGFDLHVTKPLDPGELESLLAAANLTRREAPRPEVHGRSAAF